MKLDPKEIAAWKLSDQHLEDAIRELRVTGYVIFESVLAAARVQELHSAFMESSSATSPRSATTGASSARAACRCRSRARSPIPT